MLNKGQATSVALLLGQIFRRAFCAWLRHCCTIKTQQKNLPLLAALTRGRFWHTPARKPTLKTTSPMTGLSYLETFDLHWRRCLLSSPERPSTPSNPALNCSTRAGPSIFHGKLWIVPALQSILDCTENVRHQCVRSSIWFLEKSGC